MNILYLGRYRERFSKLTKLLKELPPNSIITELCFGDLYIAEYCKKMNFRWLGIDLNPVFVKRAQKKKYNAIGADICLTEKFPDSDAIIMMGSLYHFCDIIEEMLVKIFSSTSTFILSEPIKNLTNLGGPIGFIARRSAKAGKKHEEFRFTEKSLLSVLERICGKYGFEIVFKENIGKDIIIKIVK